MADGGSVEIEVRAVTDAEIDFFFEHGWVKLPALVNRDSAAMLLDRAQRTFGKDGRKGLDREAPATEHWQSWFRNDPGCGRDPCYAALRTSTELGRNAARLLGRDSAIRMMMDATMVKPPDDSGKGNGTDFHQDTPGHMYLEANFLTPWIALDAVDQDMGAMQFYSGSHKLGNLGQVGALWNEWASYIDRFCTLTEPIALQPGDATVHANGTIHGTAPNRGQRPRWSWAGVLAPGDARYTGARSEYTDGLGINAYGPLDHPNFPVIYDPLK